MNRTMVSYLFARDGFPKSLAMLLNSGHQQQRKITGNITAAISPAQEMERSVKQVSSTLTATIIPNNPAITACHQGPQNPVKVHTISRGSPSIRVRLHLKVFCHSISGAAAYVLYVGEQQCRGKLSRQCQVLSPCRDRNAV